MEIDYDRIINVLVAADVEFIIVGGAAATAHGSSRLTTDLDVVYSRDPKNIKLLVSALEPLQPKLRGAPIDHPFQWDEETLRNGMNFPLTTSVGSLDIFGEIIGGPTFEDLVADTITLDLFGSKCLCLNLPRLIKIKEATGRPKDLDVAKELKALVQEQKRQ
ncbi:MAG TPA: hypothetical protein VFD48_07795 [Pyrinomonadaceae bacterium]|nr:hypothetical protein [Pyrinomonadaceae bacterium]